MNLPIQRPDHLTRYYERLVPPRRTASALTAIPLT
jgi:hypothetical protein